MRAARAEGFTVVELIVTLLIVTILAVTVGASLAKLLAFREDEREVAYVREKLADICAAYADYMSIGSEVNTNGSILAVDYRLETGGVSFETGRLSRVSRFLSTVDSEDDILNQNAITFDPEDFSRSRDNLRSVDGTASQMPVVGEIVGCEFRALNRNNIEDAAIGRLTLTAVCKSRNSEREMTAKVERVVRLWNRE